MQVRPSGETSPLRRLRWPAAGGLAGLLLVAGLALAMVWPSSNTSALPGDTGDDAVAEAARSARVSEATQTNEGGQVTVAVTWRGPQAGLEFEVAMDTHSVGLDGYDLGQLAVLRTDDGLEVSPLDWDAAAGGHHRKGKLVFPANTPDGEPVVGPDTYSVELVIRDVAGVPERVFRWAL